MSVKKRAGHVPDWITQVWVKLTGQRFHPEKDAWLMGPVGDAAIINDTFIYDLAQKEDLEIQINRNGSGLLDRFDELQLTTEENTLLHPAIIDFYEKTSNYHFEIWSEWRGFFKPFGWLLSVIFSKRLQQLNLPLRPLDAAKGIKSDIIKLVDKTNGSSKWTIWYRILKSTNQVIYSGVYTTCTIPNYAGKFLKVVFPLPNGNATVIMRRAILPDGSLKLSSDGDRFGDNGFYFTLTDHKGKYWARFIKSMHEWITVYVDEENKLRADHRLQFYGLSFLHLHYKMTRKSNPDYENCL